MSALHGCGQYRWAALILCLTAVAPLEGQADTSRAALADYALRAWQTTGRAAVANASGARWDSTQGWTLQADWSNEDDAASKAYFAEPPLRGMLGLAEATGNVALLEEAAGFFLAYKGRFRSVGEIQGKAPNFAARSPDLPQGAPGAMTLPWTDRRANGAVPGECVLCNAQFLHPAARLIHLIAALPAASRTKPLTDFVSSYAPLLVSQHLIRLGYETSYRGNPRGAPAQLVPLWEATATDRRYRMLDRDLWLMGTAAELLEANRLAPDLVSLQGQDARLREMVKAGTTMLKGRTTPHPETRDFSGRTVGSLGYFEGDFDDHPDMAFAGDTTDQYPSDFTKQPGHQVSWDLSHIQRLPVALRSLWQARQATGAVFPDSVAMVLTANQYIYRAFRGDYALPQFSNFFDGSDGWYRVGYGKKIGWGYPPSRYCDARTPSRPCLTASAVVGWGLLASFNPDLSRLGYALVTFSASAAPEATELRSRVYASKNDKFGGPSSGGSPSAQMGEVIGEYLAGWSGAAGPGTSH